MHSCIIWLASQIFALSLFIDISSTNLYFFLWRKELGNIEVVEAYQSCRQGVEIVFMKDSLKIHLQET